MTQKNIWYEGIAFPFVGFNPELMRKAYEEFVVNEEDVLTVTFPKSGTNWLIEILCLIRSKGDATQIQSVPIWVRSPWVETVSGYEDLKTMESPRLISTHLPIHIFPKSIHTTKAKVIYLMRNPRDVLVSGYYFWNYVKFVENTKSLQEYFELFLDGNVTHLPLFPCLDLGPRHFAFCRLPGLFQLPSILPLLSKLHEEAQASGGSHLPRCSGPRPSLCALQNAAALPGSVLSPFILPSSHHQQPSSPICSFHVSPL